MGPSGNEQMVDALAAVDEEGRGYRRYALGSRKQALIQGFPNGETYVSEPHVHQAEFIGLASTTR